MAIITRWGLPYCTDCHGEDALCPWHRKQVERELGHLRTAHTMMAEIDLRPLFTQKRRKRHDEDQ